MVILLAIAIFITMNDSPLINPKNIELNLYANVSCLSLCPRGPLESAKCSSWVWNKLATPHLFILSPPVIHITTAILIFEAQGHQT